MRAFAFACALFACFASPAAALDVKESTLADAEPASASAANFAGPNFAQARRCSGRAAALGPRANSQRAAAL